MKYYFLFILIQLISFFLFVIGLQAIAVLALCGIYTKGSDGKYHFPNYAWIWDNEEDGIVADWYRKEHSNWSLTVCIFAWSAWRNSVNNLRFVPGVSKVGRPLFYKTWMMKFPSISFKPLNFSMPTQQFYIKMGWMGNGYPACSIGKGRGY